MIGFSRSNVANFGQCLLVLKDLDAIHPDPVKDARACYKRGDIVRVMPATAHDGNVQANPISAPFYLILVTGIPLGQASMFAESAKENVQTTRRRLHGVTITDLPVSTQAALAANRYAVVQWNALRLALRNKTTLGVVV